MKTAAIYSMYKRQILKRYLEVMESQREFEDVRGVPPLDIILHRDLMDSRWSSDWLFPWRPGYVPFNVYSFYLNDYFYRNTPAGFSVRDAALTCLEMEKKLSCAGVLTADSDVLSTKIKEEATYYMIESDIESPVAFAGFMCIAEEAELMSELLACKIKNSVENDVFITEVLYDDSFNFSNMVRKTVYHIMTSYRGPCLDSVAAPLLGMKKEANLLLELLKLDRNHIDRFARLEISEWMRPHLLKFLIDINDCKFTDLLYGTASAAAKSWDNLGHARNRRKDMVSYLQSMKLNDVKDVPPLDIILYRDLMESIWSWDRLLPWKSGYVPMDFYLVYLNEYFYLNTPTVFNVNAAASTRSWGSTEGLTADVALSNKIKEQAHCMTKPLDTESPVPAACFMCIAEEAKYMSELLACGTNNSAEKDVFITEVLNDDSLSLSFSDNVRKASLDILTTYEGPCLDSVAASLLGMKKETNLLRELLKLNQKRMDRFARLEICKSLRAPLLQFLIDIHEFAELKTSVTGEDEMPCPSMGVDGITDPNPPITTNGTAPATAI